MARPRTFSDEELVDAIRLFHREQGVVPTALDFGPGRTPGLPATSTFIARFGSWGAAVEAAGFPRPRRGRRPRA